MPGLLFPRDIELSAAILGRGDFVAWPAINTQLTQTGKDAIVYLTVKAAPANAPVPLTPEPKEESAFCADVVAGRAGLYVAPLSVFSRCF